MPNILSELTLSKKLFCDRLENVYENSRTIIAQNALQFIEKQNGEPSGFAPIHVKMQYNSLNELYLQTQHEVNDLFALISSTHKVQRTYLNMKLAKSCNSLDDRHKSCNTFEASCLAELVLLLTGLTDGWFALTEEDQDSGIYLEKNKHIAINDDIESIIKAGTVINYLIYAIIKRVDPEVFALFEE